MTIPIQAQVTNPVTGVFGTGQVQFFTTSGAWTVPLGIGKVRVRLWGAGGPYNTNASNYGGGGGGGFALKAIYDLSGVTSIAVTVGAGVFNVSNGTSGNTTSGGTSSFGSYVSATGGAGGGTTAIQNAGGTGVGGDFNFTGGNGAYSSTVSSGGGGGVASIFGNGGNGGSTGNGLTGTGGAGGGSGSIAQNTFCTGGTGGFGNSGAVQYASGASNPLVFNLPVSGFAGQFFSLDLIGTGGGGTYQIAGVNGGGGAYGAYPGFPGGGNGYNSTGTAGNGLVIVEW